MAKEIKLRKSKRRERFMAYKPNRAKIIISPTEDSKPITTQDLVSIESIAGKVHSLASPLYVVFDENSEISSLLQLNKSSNTFIIRDFPTEKEMQNQLDQLQEKLLLHKYVVIFADDYRKNQVTRLVDFFDKNTVLQFNQVFEFSREMLRPPLEAHHKAI